ncbi:trypsin-like peptidase domain-containing protein [Candidatus Saccharibacteria bacterium]|nr:trypsin-like peptidase domain-containing protein [Candidatus Saccharibacteria bacterium]
MENSKDDKKPKSQPSKVTKKVKTPLTPEQKRSRSLRTGAVLLILMAFLAGVIGGAFGARLLPERITSLDNSSSGQKIVSSQSDLISKIAKDVSPSVVSINVESSTQQQSLFGDISEQVSQGAGTGIILSSDGVIITNRHVIPENVKTVSITTNDGKTYDNVSVTARDPRDNYDIAFLKVNGAKDLKPAELGDSTSMRVGDAVVAIGYALGEFSNTVTSGIISGTGRPITAGDANGSSAETLTNLFQTDAAINPGNSGGPLVNMNGQVIGINTAVAGNAQNIGFSIPINDVKTQITSILKNGKLEIPFLGVRYIMVTPALKQKYNLATDYGAWLKGNESSLAVVNGSPADKAGLKEGDIIIQVNGQKVDNKTPLASQLGKFKVGDEVELKIVRDGKEQTVKVKLESAPDSPN